MLLVILLQSKLDITISHADVMQASAMARQLHVYKPGIDFVPGARLEVLESRDNNWYVFLYMDIYFTYRPFKIQSFGLFASKTIPINECVMALIAFFVSRYQCKIVEVDWGELDILVHYERWSNRFDEWLKMDSTRIRPLHTSSLR